MSGETPNRLISALNPLEIGSTVHYAGQDWTVTGERSGMDWPAELLDYVLFERDRHVDSFSGEQACTTMGVRLADLAELYGPTSEHAHGSDDGTRGGAEGAQRAVRPRLGRGRRVGPDRRSDVRPGSTTDTTRRGMSAHS